MANGSPRSTSNQTIPSKFIQILRLSWPESSKFRDPESFRTLDGHDEIEFGERQIPTDALASLPFDGDNSNIPESKHHGQGQSISDNDSVRMRDSPAGSWYGSTNHDRMPRARPLDALPSSSPLQNPSSDTLPNRQDSAYESMKGNQDGESIVDVDVQARNIRARERVEIMRGRVLRTRRVLNESRQDLQLLREKLRDATAKLMREIDALMACDNVQNLQSLTPYYHACRMAQDELGPVEDAYDVLELRLSREEEELEQEEMHFYTHNNISLAPLSDKKLDEPVTPLVRPYQPDDVEFQNLDLENELVKQYLAKMAEAEHMKEELDDLENEQYSLTEELAFRTRYKLKLSEEKSTFLFEFPKAYKSLMERLQRVEDDLYDLRDLCIEQGLFTASEHTYEPRDALVEEIYESVNDALDRSPLRTAAQHTPSYQPHKPNFKDKRDYVNTWMLEWVQDSPVEALRLRSSIDLEYEKGGKELGGDDWPTLALGWWDRDEAGELANEKQVLSTIDALLGGTSTSNSRGSEGSLAVDLGDGHKVHEEIIGSESGSYRTQVGNEGTQLVVSDSSWGRLSEDQWSVEEP